MGLSAVLALAAAAPAGAGKKGKKKKKKKQGPPAVTRTATGGFTQASNATVTAACPKGTHVSGGGFAVSPNFNPGATTGLRSINSTSYPASAGSWTGGGSAYATPSASGSFTTIAR